MDRIGSALHSGINRITMNNRNKGKKDDRKEDGPNRPNRPDKPNKPNRPDRPDKPDRPDRPGPAPEVGAQGTVPAPPPVSPSPGGRVEAFLACARQSLGGEYCTPAREPDCTDCSGLVRRCYREATGQDIGGDSHEQIKLGTEIARSAVQPGDLLFWDTMNGTEVRGGNTASHVGIATGGNRMINALTWGMKTAESDLGSNYWTTQVKFLGARRLNF